MADIEHIELNGDTYDIADAPARESVEAESKAREEADAELQTGVEAESRAREEADTDLQTSIETESKAREEADTNLQASIEAESKAREEADTNLQNLITELDFLNQSGMVLTEGQDLDDLTDYGIKYTSSGSSISSTLINSPYSNVAFFLYVCRPYANQTQRLQIAVSASSTSTIYYRYYSGSAWGSWTKLARQQDIDNLEDDLETNAWLLYGGVRISENADLNEYTEIGNYFCNSNSRAQTLVNSPTTSAFTMKVYSGLGNNTSYLVQQINTYTLSVYERYYYNESWRAWHQVPLLDDVESAVEAESTAREKADSDLSTDITDLQNSHVCLTESEYSDLPDTKLTNDTFYFVSGGETTEGYDVYDTGWQMLTLGSDFEAYSSSTAPKYRRVGKVVTVMGQVTPTHDIEYSTGSIVIGTLPSDCYPVVQSLAMFQGSGTNVWCGTLQTNGSIGFSRYRNGSSTGICSSGNWLPFIFTFITA